MRVLVTGHDGYIGAVMVPILRDAGHLKQGDIVAVEIEDADEHDLYGVPA